MLMTGGQYRESLRKLNLMVYLFGKRIDNIVDHPVIRPSLTAL
jgi:4-hydroxybutyryl-CoA dehydratase/vinylacetyl-CoA-Delta-isomerase